MRCGGASWKTITSIACWYRITSYNVCYTKLLRLLAIAAGLSLVADQGNYSRLLVSRPVFPMGRDLGFLPGDVEEKLTPWMQPIFDNVELLLGSVEERGGKHKRGYKELVDMGILEIEPLTYIRGRSIPKQYMIVDEAQNLTPHEVKTIITRAGEGTKIILTGDPYQIDNSYNFV